MVKKIVLFQLSILLLFSAFCCSPKKDEKIAMKNEELLVRAIEFHGHLGPYLVLGLRAGLYANQVLGKDPMEIEALILTKTTPPESCFADGVQFSTGCTLGKGNISLTTGEGLLVTFKKGDQRFTLKLKSQIIEEIQSLPAQEEAWEYFAKELLQRDIQKIFEIVE